jgi:hypothetical protein
VSVVDERQPWHHEFFVADSGIWCFVDLSEICILTTVSGCFTPWLKIDRRAGAKQSVLLTGKEMVTRYTQNCNFARHHYVYLSCCDSGFAAMLSNMTFCPKSAEERQASICVQAHTKLDLI